jgi:hypothetical protein
MRNIISRRRIVKLGLCGSVLVPLIRFPVNLAEAAQLPLLDPSDPQAKGLGFVTDAGTVSAATSPTFKTGQKCAICAQFQGKPSDTAAACNIFPGHTVPAGGWCMAWAQKS